MLLKSDCIIFYFIFIFYFFWGGGQSVYIGLYTCGQSFNIHVNDTDNIYFSGLYLGFKRAKYLCRMHNKCSKALSVYKLIAYLHVHVEVFWSTRVSTMLTTVWCIIHCMYWYSLNTRFVFNYREFNTCIHVYHNWETLSHDLYVMFS